MAVGVAVVTQLRPTPLASLICAARIERTTPAGVFSDAPF